MYLFKPILTGLFVAMAARQAFAAESGHINITHEIFKIINFIIFLGVLYYFLFQRIKDYFSKRSRGIRSAIEDAQKARKEAEKRLEEVSKKLDAVGEEISKMKSEAKEDGERLRERIQQEAEDLAEKVIQQTKKSIELETKKVRTRLQEEAVFMAMEIAGEIIKKNIRPEDQERLVSEYIEKMERLS
jgi:F-type H+-transporting ATPase subunit b